jgi:hypothetical protein
VRNEGVGFTLVPGALLMTAMAGWAAVMPEPDILLNQNGQHLVVNLPQARLFFIRMADCRKSTRWLSAKC